MSNFSHKIRTTKEWVGFIPLPADAKDFGRLIANLEKALDQYGIDTDYDDCYRVEADEDELRVIFEIRESSD